MKTKLLTLIVALAFGAGTVTAAPAGKAFTYQGKLTDGANPANGNYDLKFTLYDALSSGSVVAGPLTNSATGVTNGLFTVVLDFGSVFDGNARWLEIGVRTNGVVAFATLDPRQSLTPSPYALYAPSAGTAGTATTASSVTSGSIGTAALAPGAVDSSPMAGGAIVSSNLSPALLSNTFWRLGGNAGTTAGTHFLGTTDNQPLEFKVNGVRALRLEPTVSGTPNVIGGSPGNFVGAGVAGATIAGGGANNIGTNSNYSAVGGGGGNNIAANSPNATIAGGQFNDIGTNSDYSAIGGGYDNNISANSDYSAVGGGYNNNIAADSLDATIAGGGANDIGTNSNYSAIGGGYDNNIAAYSLGATIAGGGANDIGTNSNYSAIGGGYDNNITANSEDATIAGGHLNDIGTNSDYSAIGGGIDNNIAANSWYATIAGGYLDDIGTNSDYSAIGGGNNNNIAADSLNATIAGGGTNDIGTSSASSTIGGGAGNKIADNAPFTTVPGGRNAKASGYGQMAYASGSFVNPGDAQSSLFVARRTTSGLAAAELFLDGSSKRMVVPANTTWTFEILVAARSSAGETAAYTINGLISRAGGTTFAPVYTVNTIYESDAAWGVTVSADDTNDALVISATGNTGDSIRWVASIRTAEVTY